MPKPDDEVADLPDDFFNDLTDENFIDEVIEKGGHESDEELLHYVSEINRIQNDINIRKQKIKETEANLKSHRRSRSRSRSSSRRRHREKESKRKRSRSLSPSPHISRRSRRDERIREKRYPLSPVRRSLRRSRSKSPRNTKRSSSTHRNLSFLDELAQKFAEKGQAFPERDALLMGAQGHMNNNAAMQMNAPIPMDFGNPMPFDQPIVQPPLITIPNFPQQQVGFPQQQNMFYGVNPMSILAGNTVPQPNLAPFPGVTAQPELPPIVANPIVLPQQPVDPILSNNQKALIERCDQAIKLIRAKDNKVPIMKFQYNRTSMVINSNDIAINSINKSPLQAHSTLNPSFKLNAAPNMPLKNIGLKMLPKRVKDVAQSLGINSEFLFDKMRTKEINAQITDQIKYAMDTESSKGEILIQTNTVPSQSIIEREDIGTQTVDFKCDQCTERKKRTMVNEHSQTFFRGVSIGVQTNEKDYREPIIELLSRMTAAQLVAIKDFANIVDEPRPRNTDEMYKVRERLMDIYSLSQRDADAVRAAEDSHMDDAPMMNQHRYRRGGSMYGDGPSRDFDRRRSHSPHFNGNSIGGGFSRCFEADDFGNDRNNMMDDRQRFIMEDRFRGRDGPPRPLTQEDGEEIERQRYIQMERQRELELEMNQRRYDEQRDLEHARMALQSLQQRPNPMQIDDELRFREQEEREREMEMQRNAMINAARGGGAMNRRGRGAFRDFGGRGRPRF